MGVDPVGGTGLRSSAGVREGRGSAPKVCAPPRGPRAPPPGPVRLTRWGWPGGCEWSGPWQARPGLGWRGLGGSGAGALGFVSGPAFVPDPGGLQSQPPRPQLSPVPSPPPHRMATSSGSPNPALDPLTASDNCGEIGDWQQAGCRQCPLIIFPGHGPQPHLRSITQEDGRGGPY